MASDDSSDDESFLVHLTSLHERLDATHEPYFLCQYNVMAASERRRLGLGEGDAIPRDASHLWKWEDGVKWEAAIVENGKNGIPVSVSFNNDFTQLAISFGDGKQFHALTDHAGLCCALVVQRYCRDAYDFRDMDKFTRNATFPE